MAAEPFAWRRQGRSWTVLWMVLAIWACLIAALIAFDASPVIIGVLALFTLPACWDFWSNPASGLRLDGDGIHWYSGRRRASIEWHEIDRVRLDTRLDFSVRASVMLTGGRKVRLPYESTPPHRLLEAALNARGVRTERHHFSLVG